MKLHRLNVGELGPEPPSEFRIFKAGRNESTKGTFIFDEAAQASVIAEAEEHGTDENLMIDLEHLSLDADARNFDPDARGWARLEVRNGELWAVDVRWTDDGAARIREKRQRFISPAFATDADGRIVRITNVAITALPATDQAPELIAASKTTKGKYEMDPELLKMLGLPEGATVEQTIEALKTVVSARKSLATKLEGLQGQFEEEESVAAAAREVTGEKDAGAVKAALIALKGGTDATRTLKDEIGELRKQIETRDVSDLLKANARKVSKAQEEWFLSLSKEEAEAFLKHAPEIGGAPETGNAKPPAQKEVTLTDQQLALCRQFGTKPEDLKTYMASKAGN